jgi:outer membrane protein assembly factor BamB
MKRLACALAACCFFVVAISSASAQTGPGLAAFPKLKAETDWPWWRGPMRNGIAHPKSTPPTKFSDTENVTWKVPVPGRGHSSPTIVGDQIFLATADEAKQTQSVVAFARDSGKQIWITEISQGGFPNTHNKNTHATPTVACDGDLLFVSFHHHDTLQTVALTREGKIAWNKSLGKFQPSRFEYGYAPSPVVFRNTIIIAAEFDGESHITALNRKTGAQVWRVPRPDNITFSTPSINVIGNRELLTLTGADKVACYDPASGKPLWAADGTTRATCGTTVWDGDIIFASGGFPKGETVAVRATGEVLWKNQSKCYEQSMLAYQGYLYALTDNGVLYCYKGTDGTEMWKERLQGPVSASPVFAGGHIYWANERGIHYVFKPNPQKCEIVAENKLGDESMASPAVSGNQLFQRVAFGSGTARQEFLYCFGK